MPTMKGKIGPYRIAECIGTGGMGEVFKAFDDRLDRWVAIKRIRPGKEDTDENRSRFMREAKATAALNHPSIVHVYDTLDDAEGACIVMEYVEGRTLQSMTGNGPIDAMQAIDLGKEIADGLAAAHAKQILHRDLKTENIIVTPDGHAKILDFGLAKPLITDEFDSSLTGKGQLVGTSRAMSPEYVGGDAVDHRSDLFALGVLLYETVTGHSPFKAQNTLATLKQVIVHTQPPAREVNPAVPEELSDLIDTLLEKSPEDRPQSAREVAQELRRISGQYSSGSVHHGLAGAPSDSFTVPAGEWSISTTIMGTPRLRRFWTGVLAAVVAAMVGVYFLGRRERVVTPPAEGEKVQIVLGDFQNQTTDSLLDDSLDIAFRTGIEQSQAIAIMSDREIRDALRRMEREPTATIDRELGVQLCLREGAQAFVVGTIFSVGPTYSMNAQIISAEDKVLQTVTGDASGQAEILPALQQLVRELRRYLGESLAEIESSAPLDKVTTPHLEALRLYSLGVDAQYNQDSPKAIDLFERALRIDPQFAMAHAKVGIAYRRVGRQDKLSEHFAEALKHKDRLTSFEGIYLDGWMANQSRTPDDMLRTWTLMTSLFPHIETGYHNLAIVNQYYLNRFDDAAEAYRAELEMIEPRRRPAVAGPLGYCELALGRYDEARKTFEENDVLEGLVDTYFVQERYVQGTEALDTWSLDNDAEFLTKAAKARYHIDQGQMAEARLLARELVKLSDQQGAGPSSALIALMTLISTFLHEETEALDLLLDESFQASSNKFNNQPGRLFTPIPFMATLGKISARRSELDRAQAIYEMIKEKAETGGIDLWTGYLRMLEGEILIAQGKVSEAITPLKEAVSFRGPFQAHESLAYGLEMDGDIAGAIEEHLWLEQRRGRAFSECVGICGLVSKNILDWNLALFRLGRLYETSGETDKAQEYYRRFNERWSNGDVVPVAQGRR